MRYLIMFSHESDWLDFKYAELDALLMMHSISPASAYSSSNNSKDNMFLEIELENDNIARLVSARSICIRAIYELMSGFSKLSMVLNDVSTNYNQYLQEYIKSQKSWSMQVESVFGTLTMDEKNYYRQLVPFLKALGPVEVKNPSYILTLILDMTDKPDLKDHEAIPAFFGRLVCREQMRSTVNKYDLKKRLYLGPTSLDHSLAFIMANLALAQPGQLVLDPFVGTASILVALAHFGCRCFGTDIDPRVLRGQMYAGKGVRAPDERNIFQNFKAYGLEPPELLRLDNHISDRHYQTTLAGLFDIIVTDPPYGIRAGARKSGKKGGVSYSIDTERRRDHVPITQNYPVEEVMLDLLHMAARMLVIGGHLLYLIPTTYDFEMTDLPVHPCLEILRVCEQPLSSRHGRRAVLMKKAKVYDSDLEAEFFKYKDEIMSGRDTGFGQLIHKLNRALAVNAYYDEDVVKRASNSCAQRKEALRHKKLQKKMLADTLGVPAPGNKEGDDSQKGSNEVSEAPVEVVPVCDESKSIKEISNNSLDITKEISIAFENQVISSPVQLPILTTNIKQSNATPVATSSKGRNSPRERMDGGWYHNSLLVGIGAGFAFVAVYTLLSAHFKSRHR